MTDDRHPDERDPREAVVVVTLVDGETRVHRATVVAHEQTVLRVETAAPLELGAGSVVGVLRRGSGVAHVGAVELALVSDTVGDRIADLRVLERRS